MNNNVSSGIGSFLVIYGVGLAAWVLAFIFHRRARRHYRGPNGWALLINPFARYRSKNYTAAGASLLRWELICVGVFVIACLVGFVIAREKTQGHL